MNQSIKGLIDCLDQSSGSNWMRIRAHHIGTLPLTHELLGTNGPLCVAIAFFSFGGDARGHKGSNPYYMSFKSASSLPKGLN